MTHSQHQRQRQCTRRRQNVLSRWLIQSAVSLLIVAHNLGGTVNASKQHTTTERDQGKCQASQQSPDGTCSSDTATTITDTPECSIWLAPSSLPGAGLGMYAGRDFMAGENLQPSGDIVIPFVDINHHQFERVRSHQFNFLWDEYTVRIMFIFVFLHFCLHFYFSKDSMLFRSCSPLSKLMLCFLLTKFHLSTHETKQQPTPHSGMV